MGKSTRYLVVIISIAFLTGCGLAAREINLKSQSERTGVFSEVNEAEPPPKGSVDLLIKTSIKTHLEGYYLIESEKNCHGQEGYPVLINIDGQAITWKLKGEKEILPSEKGTNNPEEGEGIRYRLNKRIRLAPGLHKIFFGLPGEKVYKEVNLTLMESSVNVLEFKPIYRPWRGQRTCNFLHGVDGGELYINGNPLR